MACLYRKSFIFLCAPLGLLTVPLLVSLPACLCHTLSFSPRLLHPTTVVPPGYVLRNDSTSMAQCGNGEYRPGWLLVSDPRATTCLLCGENIASEARDLDENPLASQGALVRANSECCCELLS